MAPSALRYAKDHHSVRVAGNPEEEGTLEKQSYIAGYSLGSDTHVSFILDFDRTKETEPHDAERDAA